MKGSHDSLKEDYDATTPALDAMAEAAWTSVGCLGARMTGAGFGGACVALVAESDADEFEAQVMSRYRKVMQTQTGSVMRCRAVNGAKLQ